MIELAAVLFVIILVYISVRHVGRFVWALQDEVISVLFIGYLIYHFTG